jgi:hypothetical protein
MRRVDGFVRVALAITAVVLVLSTVHAQTSAPEVASVRARSEAGAPAQPATVEQPRPFGYVVGDLLTQRVLLERPPKDSPPGNRPKECGQPHSSSHRLSSGARAGARAPIAPGITCEPQAGSR